MTEPQLVTTPAPPPSLVKKLAGVICRQGTLVGCASLGITAYSQGNMLLAYLLLAVLAFVICLGWWNEVSNHHTLHQAIDAFWTHLDDRP